MEHIKNKLTKCRNCGAFEIIFNGSTMKEYYENGFHGISHLVEHCMCEKVKDIESEMNMLGLRWNAYTADTKVVFYVSGLIKSVQKIRDKFMNAILNYEITQDVFERERKIVITEYNQYFSDQFGAFQLNFLRKHYNYCDPIGLKSDLESITYENFMGFKRKWFSHPSFIGYVYPSGYKKLNEDSFKKYESKYNKLNFSNEQNNREYKLIFNSKGYNSFPIETYSNFDSQRVVLMVAEYDRGNNLISSTYSKIFKDMICGGLTSPLYQELREKTGHVYSIYVLKRIISNTKESFEIYVSTQAEYVNEIKDLLKSVIDNINSYINEKMFNVSLTKLRNFIKLSEYTTYDYEFDEDLEIVKNNILSDSINYNDMKNFIKMFENTNKFYFQDDQFI